MKTKYNDFGLTKNTKAANAYMDEVAKESNFTGHHKGYTILPHKIHRCYGLSPYEKLILVDIVAYMSDQSQCYPTIEMIARNVGCSSKSVERHIATLAEKKLILVQDMKRSRELIKETEVQLRGLLAETDFKLQSMDGISTVTAAELIAEIGDIRRFPNADKLARFAGIAPVRFSSGGKGKDKASGQGNRVLNAIFHNLAVQQIQVAKGDNKKQRNPVFYEYYQRKLAEGKTKKQALICVMRRLVNIIYSMMKYKTPYIAAAALTERKAS